MATPRKNTPLCCVTIHGYIDVILPTAKVMQLVEILQSSFNCKKTYVSGKGYVYKLTDGAPKVEFITVNAAQLQSDSPPARQRSGPLLLEGIE